MGRGAGPGGRARGVCGPRVQCPRAFFIPAPPPRHSTPAHFLTHMKEINLFESGVLTSPRRARLPHAAGPPLFLSRLEFSDPRPKCVSSSSPPAVFAHTCWLGHAAPPLLPCCYGDSTAAPSRLCRGTKTQRKAASGLRTTAGDFESLSGSNARLCY